MDKLVHDQSLSVFATKNAMAAGVKVNFVKFFQCCICETRCRDSQASTGDEREPSMISNEYVELSPVLTSSTTSQGTFNYSSPIASQHSNSHLYMNTAG